MSTPSERLGRRSQLREEIESALADERCAASYDSEPERREAQQRLADLLDRYPH